MNFNKIKKFTLISVLFSVLFITFIIPAFSLDIGSPGTQYVISQTEISSWNYVYDQANEYPLCVQNSIPCNYIIPPNMSLPVNIGSQDYLHISYYFSGWFDLSQPDYITFRVTANGTDIYDTPYLNSFGYATNISFSGDFYYQPQVTTFVNISLEVTTVIGISESWHYLYNTFTIQRYSPLNPITLTTTQTTTDTVTQPNPQTVTVTQNNTQTVTQNQSTIFTKTVTSTSTGIITKNTSNTTNTSKSKTSPGFEFIQIIFVFLILGISISWRKRKEK